MDEAETEVKAFNKSQLTEKQREDLMFVEKRIGLLQESRQMHHGVNLDTLYTDADKNYVPHRIGG